MMFADTVGDSRWMAEVLPHMSVVAGGHRSQPIKITGLQGSARLIFVTDLAPFLNIAYFR